MRSAGLHMFGLLMACWSIQSAQAQRREGEPATATLEFDLPVAARFGEVTLPARRYRLTVGSDGFGLSDPQTMVLVATVAFQESTDAQSVAQPKVEVRRKGRELELIVRHADRVLKAVGQVVEAGQPTTTKPVVLTDKPEASLAIAATEEQSELAMMQTALKRYLTGIRHCADKVRRNRWETDDPRFAACVCPIAFKWRLPKTAAGLRVHQPLVVGESGITLSVSDQGKVTDCRVWIGAKPPADPTDVQSPADPTAPGPTGPADAKPPAIPPPANKGTP